jgi:leucyl-tRNA synthetase
VYVDEQGQAVSAKEVRKSGEGGYQARDGRPVTANAVAEEDVEKQDDEFVLKSDPTIRIESRANKMSKSRGNVVNPDAIVQDYGADALRLYEMFMGPLEATKPWSMAGVGGVRNFLDRVWRLIVDDQQEDLVLQPALCDQACDDEQNRMLHATIKKVTEDTESMSFNTAIARMMEFTKFFTRCDRRPVSAMRTFLILLSPYAPHLCEELWRILGGDQSIAHQSWPSWDEQALVQKQIEVPVQFNGKVKTKIHLAPDAKPDQMIAAALDDQRVQSLLEGKQVVKQIAVPGRLVNLVVK